MKLQKEYVGTFFDWYLFACQVIISLLTIDDAITYFINTYPGYLYGNAVSLLYYVASPAYILKSILIPDLQEYSHRKAGILVMLFFTVIVVLLLQYIRNFIKATQKNSLYSREGLHIVLRVTQLFTAATAINAITMIVYFFKVVFVGASYVPPLGQYVSLVFGLLPYFLILFTVALWGLYKIYHDAIELKNEAELTI